MRAEHALDPRGARAALEPLDHALPLHQGERRHRLDLEALGELGLLSHVDRRDAQPRALLAGEVSHQAFHPPRGARVGGAEKDQQRACIFSHRHRVFPAKKRVKPRLQGRVYTQRTMWEAYRIGVSLGLGIGIGGLLSALVAPRRALVVVVALAAAAAGAPGGWGVGGWHEGGGGGGGGAPRGGGGGAARAGGPPRRGAP